MSDVARCTYPRERYSVHGVHSLVIESLPLSCCHVVMVDDDKDGTCPLWLERAIAPQHTVNPSFHQSIHPSITHQFTCQSFIILALSLLLCTWVLFLSLVILPALPVRVLAGRSAEFFPFQSSCSSSLPVFHLMRLNMFSPAVLLSPFIVYSLDQRCHQPSAPNLILATCRAS